MQILNDKTDPTTTKTSTKTEASRTSGVSLRSLQQKGRRPSIRLSSRYTRDKSISSDNDDDDQQIVGHDLTRGQQMHHGLR